VIFAGLTASDFQRLRRNQDIPTAPLLAASIFLDILNVLLLFLSIFRGRGDPHDRIVHPTADPEGRGSVSGAPNLPAAARHR
jgi:hypothetical protein